MITITYNASDQIESFAGDSSRVISNYELITHNVPIFNYAAFNKQGIDLFDASIKLGTPSDYYGISDVYNYGDLLLANKETHSVDVKYVTLNFYRNPCKQIYVYKQENTIKTLLTTLDATDPKNEYYNESGYLPLTVNIPLNITLPAHDGDPNPITLHTGVLFTFNQDPDNIISVQGAFFGKIINLKDILDYNSVYQINPIGDDLALNECNLSASIKDEFVTVENQTLNFYNDSEVLEYDVLTKISTDARGVNSIKCRNIIQNASELNMYANYTGDLNLDYDPLFKSKDWNTVNTTVEQLMQQFKAGYQGLTPLQGNPIKYPDWFKNIEISYFINASTARKLLQQICWMTCCALTTSNKYNPEMVPFREIDELSEITILNSDDKIISTELIQGEVYSDIILQNHKFIRKQEKTKLGTIRPSKSIGQNWIGTFSATSPMIVTDIVGLRGGGVHYAFNDVSPYFVKINFHNNSGEQINYDKNFDILGYAYNDYIKSTTIPFNRKGKVLTISDQFLGMNDLTPKIEQLKHWYMNNNTLKATIVDDENLIKLGMILNIQLENKKMFKGIITQIERDNISTYHTINVEVHQWN